jgi:hypothetical protein
LGLWSPMPVDDCFLFKLVFCTGFEPMFGAKTMVSRLDVHTNSSSTWRLNPRLSWLKPQPIQGWPRIIGDITLYHVISNHWSIFISEPRVVIPIVESRIFMAKS